MYDIDINQCSASGLFNRAISEYKGQIDKKAVSPSILSEANMLAMRADELESFFDEKIAEMQGKLKDAAEDLALEDYVSHFYLNQQRRKTDYYSRHPNLVHIQQGVRVSECGLVCTWMVAADRNENFLQRSEVEKMLEEAEKLNPVLKMNDKAGILAIIYPMLLKALKHPIEYQFVEERNIIQQKQPPANNPKMLPMEGLIQKYHSHMGRYPHNTTVDQLKKAIGQKGSEGEVIPVIVCLIRERKARDPQSENRFDCHAIIIDALKTIDGEECVVFRDPNTEVSVLTGKPLTEEVAISWKDFLEIWDGRASIPYVNEH